MAVNQGDFRQTFLVALRMFQSGSLTEAENNCLSILSQIPQQPETLHLLGLIHRQNGDHAAAIQRISEANAFSPGNAEFLNSLGAAYLSDNQPELAAQKFREAIQRQADIAGPHLNLGLALLKLQDLDGAESSLLTAKRLNPKSSPVHLHLGTIYRHRHDFDNAISACQTALKLSPGWGEALRQLGLTYQQMNRLIDAEQTLRLALKANPSSAEGWNDLGVVLVQAGRADEAETCFDRALQNAPDFVTALVNSGTAKLQRGSADTAIELFGRANEVQADAPVIRTGLLKCHQALGNHAEAVGLAHSLTTKEHQPAEIWRRLGISLELLGRFGEAIEAYQTAYQLEPEEREALSGLLRLTERQEDDVAAIQYGQKLLQQRGETAESCFLVGSMLARISQKRKQMPLPLSQLRQMEEESLRLLTKAASLTRSAETYQGLGTSLRHANRHDQAVSTFQDALQCDNKSWLAHCSLGSVLVELGDTEQALSHFERALELNSDAPLVRYHLASNRASPDPESEIATLRGLLSQQGWSVQEQIHLHFAIARIADNARRYDEAFLAYTAGNALKRSLVPKSQASPRSDGPTTAAQLKQLFTSEFLQARRGWGNPDARPIFVVGMPRSGTTLTEQVLASHPDVYGAGELPDLGYLARRLARPGNSGSQNGNFASIREVREAAEEYLQYTSQISRNAQRVVDKMPGNFLFLGVIAILFPQATIINCRRDPRDICVSCFRSNLDWPYSDLSEVDRLHQDYEDLMTYWRQVLPISIYDQQYETLTTDFDSQARRLIAACGLEWDERCLQFYESKRTVRTPSHLQVRKPIYTSSIGLWRRYSSHLTQLGLAESEEDRLQP